MANISDDPWYWNNGNQIATEEPFLDKLDHYLDDVRGGNLYWPWDYGSGSGTPSAEYDPTKVGSRVKDMSSKSASADTTGLPSNQAMFGFAAGVKASGDRTQAIVDANNELSWYYSIVQEAMNNQTITDLNQMRVNAASVDADKRVRRKSLHQKASIRAIYAGRNIRISGGSPVDVIHSTNVIEAEERGIIERNRQFAEDANELKRLNYKRKEEAARNKASTINPSARGNRAFMGSLLSSAGSFAMAQA